MLMVPRWASWLSDIRPSSEEALPRSMSTVKLTKFAFTDRSLRSNQAPAGWPNSDGGRSQDVHARRTSPAFERIASGVATEMRMRFEAVPAVRQSFDGGVVVPGPHQY